MNNSVHWEKKCKVTQNQVLNNKIKAGVPKVHRSIGAMIWAQLVRGDVMEE